MARSRFLREACLRADVLKSLISAFSILESFLGDVVTNRQLHLDRRLRRYLSGLQTELAFLLEGKEFKYTDGNKTISMESIKQQLFECLNDIQELEDIAAEPEKKGVDDEDLDED